MLLEDTHEICIGCGADVKDIGSYTLYPPDVETDLEKEKDTNKRTGKTITAIVLVFILLVALVLILAVMASISQGREDAGQKELSVTDEDDKNAIADADEDPGLTGIKDPAEGLDEIDEDADEDMEGKGDINDSLGMYYTIADISDDAGNKVFRAVYPEDLAYAEYIFDYGRYSNRYPESLQFIATNSDDTVKFTYMSPSQMWYKESETGRSRKNERDAVNYMSYYTYEGATAYLEALIRLSYDNAKDYELIESLDADPVMDKRLLELSESQTERLSGNIGDYARIGEGTEYVVEAFEYDARFFRYRMTDGEKTIYLDFYVPLIANRLYYANENTNDRGRVTEWIVLSMYSFEAGSGELHDEYANAFKEFIHNTSVDREFFYINNEYGKEIDEALESGLFPKAITKDRLSEIGKEYRDSSDVGDLNRDICDFLCLAEPESRSFTADDISIVTTLEAEKVYYNEDMSKLFISPGENEYPGSGYTELKR